MISSQFLSFSWGFLFGVLDLSEQNCALSCDLLVYVWIIILPLDRKYEIFIGPEVDTLKYISVILSSWLLLYLLFIAAFQ